MDKSKKRRGGYLQPTIRDEHLEIINSLVEEKMIYCSQNYVRLKERTGISVSVTTMHRAVQRLDLRQKKNSLRR